MKKRTRKIKIAKLNLHEQLAIYTKRLTKHTETDLSFGMTKRQRLKQELYLRLKIANIESRINAKLRKRILATE